MTKQPPRRYMPSLTQGGWHVAPWALLVVLGACGSPHEEGPEPEPIGESSLEIADLAVDGEQVYWIAGSYDNGSVSAMPLDGGSPQVLVAEGGSSVSVDANQIYWLNEYEMASQPIAGGDLIVYVDTSVSAGLTPKSKTLTLDAAHVFGVMWDRHTEEQLLSANKGAAGGGLSSLDDGVQGLAADGDALYVTTLTGAVRRILQGTGDIETLAEGQRDASFIAVDDTSVYWWVGTANGDADGPQLMKVAKTGGTPTAIFEGSPTCSTRRTNTVSHDFVVDGGNIYFTALLLDDAGGSCDDVNHAVLRLGVGGGEPQILSQHTSIHEPIEIAVGDSYVYFVEDHFPDPSVVKRVPKNP